MCKLVTLSCHIVPQQRQPASSKLYRDKIEQICLKKEMGKSTFKTISPLVEKEPSRYVKLLSFLIWEQFIQFQSNALLSIRAMGLLRNSHMRIRAQFLKKLLKPLSITSVIKKFHNQLFTIKLKTQWITQIDYPQAMQRCYLLNRS